MSMIKRYLENISVEMGLDGKITSSVIKRMKQEEKELNELRMWQEDVIIRNRMNWEGEEW